MQQRWTRDFLSPFKADMDCWQYLFVVVVDCGTSRFVLDSVALVAAQPEMFDLVLAMAEGVGGGHGNLMQSVLHRRLGSWKEAAK